MIRLYISSELTQRSLKSKIREKKFISLTITDGMVTIALNARTLKMPELKWKLLKNMYNKRLYLSPGAIDKSAWCLF